MQGNGVRRVWGKEPKQTKMIRQADYAHCLSQIPIGKEPIIELEAKARKN